MSSNFLVERFKSLISNDENSIETRQNGRLEINLLGCVLKIIVSTIEGVRCRQDGGSRVENGRDTGFSNGDSLLLHSFMDGNSILWAHLVKLIDADDATISENHGSAFELELACSIILNHGSSQTCC